MSWLMAALMWGKANVWPLAILAVVGLLVAGKVNIEQVLNALIKKTLDSDKEKDK